MDRIIVMDKTKQVRIIADNTRRLMQAADMTFTRLSKESRVDQGTISKLLATDTLPNPTMKVITGIASAFNIAPWMLLVESFPFHLVGSKPLKTVSDDSYILLRLYEDATPELRRSILDYVSYQVRGDKKTEDRIKEAASKYTLGSDGKYPGCAEDHS